MRAYVKLSWQIPDNLRLLIVLVNDNYSIKEAFVRGGKCHRGLLSPLPAPTGNLAFLSLG